MDGGRTCSELLFPLLELFPKANTSSTAHNSIYHPCTDTSATLHPQHRHRTGKIISNVLSRSHRIPGSRDISYRIYPAGRFPGDISHRMFPAWIFPGIFPTGYIQQGYFQGYFLQDISSRDISYRIFPRIYPGDISCRIYPAGIFPGTFPAGYLQQGYFQQGYFQGNFLLDAGNASGILSSFWAKETTPRMVFSDPEEQTQWEHGQPSPVLVFGDAQGPAQI